MPSGQEAGGDGGGRRAPLHGKELFIARRRRSVSGEEAEFREHAISQVRSVVEHPFHYVKDVMGTRRTRRRGLEGNDQMLCMCFALANLLVLGRKRVAVAAS